MSRLRTTSASGLNLPFQECAAALKTASPIEYPPDYQQRRIIGRLYYGDVDVDLLAEIPLAVADVDGNPVAWRIYGGWGNAGDRTRPACPGRGRLCAARSVSTGWTICQINPRLAEGLFYYELPPLRALEWMPYIQTFWRFCLC